MIIENQDVFNTMDPKKKDKRVKLQKIYLERKEQLSLSIPHYEKGMREAYEKCEVIERAKLAAIEKSLKGLVDIYSLEKNDRLNQFKESLKEAYNFLDVEKDLKFWCDTFGPDAEYDFFQSHEFKVKRPVSAITNTLKDEEPTNIPMKTNSKTPCYDDESTKE
ncbi:hypothetical protein MXB_3600 [Myxobolus squamalis]|nr:hypothetical protein MXB_3600 [Myxobolus squamalis]